MDQVIRTATLQLFQTLNQQEIAEADARQARDTARREEEHRQRSRYTKDVQNWVSSMS